MMELLAQLPWSIKAAWVVVAAWAIAQLVWYGRVRVMPPPPPPRRSDSSRRRPAGNNSAPGMATALPTGGSPEFLAELGLHDPDGSSSPSVYR